MTSNDFSGNPRASMGPRLFSRGNDGAQDAVAVRIGSFNGAAALQPRKCSTPAAGFSAPYLASMGPRLFSRGNARRVAPLLWLSVSLQWGRGSSAAEMALSDWLHRETANELQWGRGSSAAEMRDAFRPCRRCR